MAGKEGVTGGKEGMIGLVGRVIIPLNPEGVIKVRGELWKALSTEDNIGIGENVVVVGIQKLVLFVKRNHQVV